MRIGEIVAWGAGLVSVGIGAAFLTLGLGGGGSGMPEAETARAQTCPPVVSIAPRGPGQPRDDILGVRLGFTISDVAATLTCINDRYKIRFEGVWHTMERSAGSDHRQLLYAERDRELLAAGLVGAPGQERVAALWRTIRYDVKDAPARADLEAELVKHFGTPHQAEETKLRRVLVWAYDPNGLPLKPEADGSTAGGVLQRVGDWIAGAVTIPHCAEHLKASPLDRPEFSAQCGLTIRAEIEGDLQAASRASAVKVALADQARAKTLIEGYRAARPK